MVEQWLDALLKIRLVGRVDLGGDAQFAARTLGDGDGTVGPLLRGNPAKESEIALRRLGNRMEQALGQAVRDRGGPIVQCQRAALMLRCFEGLDYTEIAASVGGSAEAARANVYQAMRKLRAALGRDVP